MTLVERFIQKYGRLPTEFDKDYLEMLRMSKYKLLDAPHYKPAKCANCGSTKVDGRKYVDFGLEIAWYGIVYICTLCLDDIAKNIGLFDSYQATIEQLDKKINYLVNQNKDDSDLVSRLSIIMEEVNAHLADLRTSSDNSDSDRTSDVESAEPKSIKTEPAVKSTNSRTTKSTTSSGSKNVPSLADLLNADS